MEFTNPERKSISELVEHFSAEKKTIVIIGAGEAGSMVKRVMDSDHLVGIHVVDLPEKDQKNIMEQMANNTKQKVFEKEPTMYIKPYEAEPLPHIELRKKPYQEKFFAGFSKRKRKK